MTLTIAETAELESLLFAEDRYQRSRLFYDYYPDTGPLRRELYVKHTAFFAAGANYRERAAIAANRIGKTEGMGGYEMVCHLTGNYPDWWTGRRFDSPIDAWAGGDTGESVRDIIQAKLLGKPGLPEEHGTGLIPGELIIKTSPRTGIPNAIQTVFVRHSSGGISTLGLKTYDQGRKSWQGTSKHVVWFDEEPPEDVYAEGLLRTMDCDGITMLTFTPLCGLSSVVLSFLPGGALPENGYLAAPTKFIIGATWDDAPHLSKAARDELWAALPPHQREARSKGVPSLGSGAIYPVPESEIAIPDFDIPKHWPRAFGMDVGWNCTAAVWGAFDRESDCWYLYAMHVRGQAEPSIHADAIKARGAWINGVIDPAAKGSSQKDGQQLMRLYEDHGLLLTAADNSVEAGIHDVWQRMSSGRIKVFSTMFAWFEEFRLYRRDDKGRVVKVNDHAMDCTRYLIRSGPSVATTKPLQNSVRDNYQQVLLESVYEDQRGKGRPGPMSS